MKTALKSQQPQKMQKMIFSKAIFTALNFFKWTVPKHLNLKQFLIQQFLIIKNLWALVTYQESAAEWVLPLQTFKSCFFKAVAPKNKIMILIKNPDRINKIKLLNTLQLM
jgi:hypothetical protein